MAKVKTSGDGASRAEDAQAAEFGAALRQTRIAHGRELGEVAAQLRIRQVYLQAMEDGRFDDLPGPTYAIGFVRAYADYLGLDENEVVKRYKDLRGGTGAPANLVPPVAPVAEGRLPTGSVLLLGAVLAAAAYGGWYYLSMKGRDPGELVAALPDRIAAMVGLKREHAPSPDPTPASAPPPAPSAAEPAMAKSQPPSGPRPADQPAAASPAPGFQPMAPTAPTLAVPTQPPAAAPAPGAQPSEAARAPTEAAEAVTAPPAPSAEPRAAAEPAGAAPPPAPAARPTVPQTAESTAPAAPAQPEAAGSPAQAPAAALPPSDSAGVPSAPPVPDPASQTAARAEPATDGRVVLRANASAWVEIRNAEDRRVFSRLMRAGESYPVPATPGLTLTTGNAGGLAIVVDGRSLPPLGRQGDVRRDVTLDAETLLRQAGTTP